MSSVVPPPEWVSTVVDSLSGVVLRLESLSREVHRLSSQLAVLVAAATPPPGVSPSSTAGELSPNPRPGHVGIVTGPGMMIDAPYTGTVVRYDTFDQKATIGPMDFWGYTDPAAINERMRPAMLLVECNDSPYGPKSWYTIEGGLAVHVPDPATLNVLVAAGDDAIVDKVAGVVSWAWLRQYVPKVSTGS